MNWFLIFLSICRFGDFSLSKLLIFLSICRFCALLASKCWSFLSICRFWAFPYQNVCFFEYMQVWGTWGSPNLHVLKKDQRSGAFPYRHVCFLSICRFERLEVHQTCIYSKKINMLMPKVHKTCIYSKKSKVLIVKSHQTCIYSKKSKKSKISDSMWDWLA